MHIFIDESGTFAIPKDGQTSPCIIGALVVPDFKKGQLENRYERMRQNLPKEGGEVKGRLLCEQEVARVIDLLRKNVCIFEAVIIEMSLESLEGIEKHRAGAAERLTANLTEQHQKTLVEQVWKLREQLEGLAPPLYVQYTLASELLADVIRYIPSFWAQRRMQELLTYHWVVDGKGSETTTSSEDWWETTKSGFLQSKLARSPMMALDWLDYSEVDKKFKSPMPEYLQESLFPGEEDGYDLNLLLNESFRFSSGSEFGLELVDIVTNATRRALKGNLRYEGWGSIPELMILRREECLKFRTLSSEEPRAFLPYRRIVTKGFGNGRRAMLTKEHGSRRTETKQ